MAGAAVAGAVGAVALRAVPADASAAALTFDVNSYGASNSNQSNGTTGWYGSATYTNGASLLIMDAFTHTPAINAGGLQVFTKGTGTGGYFVSQSGYDLWINGTGRMAQLGRSDVGATAPNWTPGTAPITNSLGSVVGTSYFEELVRGNDSSLWASRTSGTLRAAWKRVNTVRVDSASGDGSAFVPARIIDTRNGTGGHTGQLQPNTTTVFGPFTNTNGIPPDALGIVGNISAIGFSGAGFLTMFPTGAAQPGIASVQFGGGLFSIGNGFTAGFGTGANVGKISIYVSNNVAAHCTVDITGYIQ